MLSRGKHGTLLYFILLLILASNLQNYDGAGPLPSRLQPPFWHSPYATRTHTQQPEPRG